MELNKIYQGDSLEVLKTFPDECIDMVITSPPYWALRDYGSDGQLGIEKTFNEYINNLCNVFDEIKRVLKKGGSCWVNIGDTYSAQRWSDNKGTSFMVKGKNSHNCAVIEKKSGLPNKCLCQIPARFAIEMINRGWILRNEIIWHKPNCMPSSVSDRFTVDFEKIFFFVKNQKYYFEQQLEPLADMTKKRLKSGKWESDKDSKINKGILPMSSDGFNKAVKKMEEKGMRNKRSVWKISPRAFKEAHFAVYPEELIITPIKAGCPEGGSIT